MPKQILQPDTVWDTLPRSFAQVVVVPAAQRLVFVSGQTAFDRDGNVVGAGDIAEQTRVTLDNLKLCLEAAGATLEDVAMIRVFLTDIRHMPAMQEVRARYFPNPPASTGLQVSALAHPDLLIEIDAIAFAGGA